MEPIKITQFREEIANAILNSQDKLNPDKDAYINEEELPNVLAFFGETDVKKLLKSDSVFEEEPSTETENVDKVEISSKSDRHKNALEKRGTAANEAFSITSADLLLNSAGDPQGQQMEMYKKLQSYIDQRSGDSSGVDEKIELLKLSAEDYIKQNPEDENKKYTQKEVVYGANKDKKGILEQYVGLSTVKASKANDNKDELEEYMESVDEVSPDNNDDSTGTDAQVTYNLKFHTLAPEEKGNWYTKVGLVVGSDKCVGQGAALYTKKLKNNGYIDFTFLGSQTIEHENNVGTFSAAFDYQKKKLGTGIYGMYKDSEVDGVKTINKSAEAYANYGDTDYVRTAFGMESENDAKYYYLKGELRGDKDLKDRGITLSGGASAEYGVVKYAGIDIQPKNLEIKADGRFTFKANNDLGVDILGNIATRRTKYPIENQDVYIKSLIASILAKISTKDIDLSANITTIKTNDDYVEGVTTRPTTTTATFLFDIKTLFKDVVLRLKYGVGDFDGANHNFGVSAILPVK